MSILSSPVAFERVHAVCRAAAFLAIASIILCACDPHHLLDVSVPPNVTDPSTLKSVQGAEAMRAGVIEGFAYAVGGFYAQVGYSGVLSDELQAAQPSQFEEAMAARTQDPISSNQPTDNMYKGLQKIRGTAEQAITALARYEPTARGEIAELFALEAYAEMLLGEDMCAGVPFSEVSPSGGVVYGDPLPSDSIFGRAGAHFDSALAYATTDSVANNLARIGKARLLLNRGQFGAAAALASAVPFGYRYTTQVSPGGFNPSWYATLYQIGFFLFVVADTKGINGLDYVSANDPRMPTVRLGTTDVGTPWIYPLKFSAGTIPAIPLADYVESRLIVAEAALHAGDVVAWADTLNALRATAITPAMPPLTSDSTTGASAAMQIDVMFRERAFWTYGTGKRLGDLRRLIRQYGRDQATVFPTGPYVNGSPTLFTTYGTDVNFPLFSAERANPKFHGCLNRSA